MTADNSVFGVNRLRKIAQRKREEMDALEDTEVGELILGEDNTIDVDSILESVREQGEVVAERKLHYSFPYVYEVQEQLAPGIPLDEEEVDQIISDHGNVDTSPPEISDPIRESDEGEKKIVGFMPRSRLTLSPSYMRDFKCIGPICEDSCCLGWRVNIDYDTYQKYRACKDSVLAPMFKNYIKRVRSGGKKGNVHSNDYAHVKGASVRCEFLSPEDMCLIQQRLGEDYLSHTCHDYPRTINKVDRFIERSLTMSCPEAARKVLLNPEIMTFDQSEEPVDSRGLVFTTINTAKIPVKRRLDHMSQFWLVRDFLISLLQNRNYTIEMRLILMGKFIELMEEYVGRPESDFVAMVQSFHQQVEDLTLIDLMKDLPTNYDFQAQLMIEILEERMALRGLSQRYLDILAPVLQGIKYGFSTDEIVANYRRVLMEKYEPYMLKHSYILENYFVNLVFKELFPFKGKNFFEEYSRLISTYSVIRLHLIGLSAVDELNLDNIVYVFQIIGRHIEHSPTFVKGINQKMKNAGFQTTAHLATLINN